MEKDRPGQEGEAGSSRGVSSRGHGKRERSPWRGGCFAVARDGGPDLGQELGRLGHHDLAGDSIEVFGEDIPVLAAGVADLVIPGHTPVSAITQSILDESGIPYIRIHKSTAEVYSALLDHVSKITAEDTEKLDLLYSSAETYLNFEEIDALF